MHHDNMDNSYTYGYASFSQINLYMNDVLNLIFKKLYKH